MNNEQAIQLLKNIRKYAVMRDGDVVALDMAIKALEQESCEDTISRAAVLGKAINVPIAKVVTEDKVIYRKIVFADDIENLPSVTPKPETVTEFADRCRECGRERVLDKIRAEIEDVAFDWQEIDGEHESFMVVDLNDAIQIIDKYKAESGE